jgi:hypothetical protein
METYNHLKNKILDINEDLRLIIRKAGSIDGLSNHPLEAWKATTDSIHRQLAEEMIGSGGLHQVRKEHLGQCPLWG